MNDPSFSPVLHASLLALTLACAACASASRMAPDAAPPATLRTMYGLPRPTAIQVSRTALVLVDFQEEFFHGRLPIPDGPAAVDHAAALLRWARANGVTVAHVRNVSVKLGSPLFAPGSPTIAIVPPLAPAPSEVVITKSTAGGFSRTDLDATLKAKGIEQIIVAGIMTHLAVDSTARDGLVLGYRVLVAADATATRSLPGALGDAPIDHRALQRASLAALADRFADVLATDEIVALPVER